MTAAENSGANSFVLLQVGERRFALPADTVAELAPPVRLHTFPHSSALVAGVIVRRGRIVPVYDVAPALLGTKSPAHRFYLIAQRDFGDALEPSAIPLNGECELATAEMQPPATGRPAYVSGTLAVGDESVEVLDFEALVSPQPADTNDSAPAEAQP
ncbi:MAG: chemotaxis protein CheW [Candidatus Acidiferrales bacterium]